MPLQKEKRSHVSSSNTQSWPGCLASRAEKSRHAAKMRRDKESEEIAALSKLLPYPEEVINHLDKGSIIRLATSFLRMKKFSQTEHTEILNRLKTKAITYGDSMGDEAEKENVEFPEGTLMLQALNGFVSFISRKGRVLYVSDNVTKHLGLNQYEMVGKSFLDFIHQQDHKELAKQFMVQVPGQQTFNGYGIERPEDLPTSMSVDFFSSADEEVISVTDFVQERSFFLRMKSVMAKKSSSGKGKVVGYRVVNFTGRLKLKKAKKNKGFAVEGLICLCRPIQPLPLVEIRMDGNMFMSRHGMDMSFTFCDPRIITLIGYEPHELIGKTAYQFHNPLDAKRVSDCHSNLIVKGSSMSKYYRFLGKQGQWVWMQTKATIIYNTSGVAQYVVCMNYIIGKDEGERYLMLQQLQEEAGKAFPRGSPDSFISSPGSTGMNSEVSSDSEEPRELPMEEIIQYIPKDVLENKAIMKPVDDNEVCDFSFLDSKEPVISEVESMDTFDSKLEHYEENISGAQNLNDEIAIEDNGHGIRPSWPHTFNVTDLKHDSPQSDMESISSGSSGSASSPGVKSIPDTTHDSVQTILEEDVNIEDTIDLTQSNRNETNFGSDSFISFPLNSLDLSKTADSIFRLGNTSKAFFSEALGGIMDSNVFSEARNLSCKQEIPFQKHFTLTVTPMDPSDGGPDENQVPETVACFVDEYCQKVMDQNAHDTIARYEEDFRQTEEIDSPPNGISISEISASNSCNYGATNSVSNTSGLNINSNNLFTSGNPTSSSESCSQYSVTSPVVFNKPSTTSQVTSTCHSFSFTPDSQKVTERISKLVIKDTRQLPTTRGSRLKALLMGSIENPLATGTEPNRRNFNPGTSNSRMKRNSSDDLSSCSPSVNANMQSNSPLGALMIDTDVNPPFNNNSIHQEDSAFLEHQEQQLLHLKETQRQQALALSQQHALQQQYLQKQLMVDRQNALKSPNSHLSPPHPSSSESDFHMGSGEVNSQIHPGQNMYNLQQTQPNIPSPSIVMGAFQPNSTSNPKRGISLSGNSFHVSGPQRSPMGVGESQEQFISHQNLHSRIPCNSPLSESSMGGPTTPIAGLASPQLLQSTQMINNSPSINMVPSPYGMVEGMCSNTQGTLLAGNQQLSQQEGRVSWGASSGQVL